MPPRASIGISGCTLMRVVTSLRGRHCWSQRPGGSDAWRHLAFFNLSLRRGVFDAVLRGGANDTNPKMGSGIPRRWAVLDEPYAWHGQSPGAWPAVHDRRRDRRRVALHAIEVYFAWVNARAAADADLRAELDAEQRLAELDALTDGWFSQALAKAAESR